MSLINWWPNGGGGGGAVASVFGRVGAVVAAVNDYLASQVGNDSGVGGASVADALDTLDAEIAAIPAAPVSSVFGRIGAVIAASGDYVASQVGNNSGVAGASVADALNALASAILALTSTQISNASTVAGATVTAALNALLTALDAATFLLADFAFTSATGAGVNDFLAPFGLADALATEARNQILIPVSCNATALTITSTRTGGVSGNTTAVLRKNGVATALTVTLTAGQNTARVTGGPIAFVGGTDKMSVQMTALANGGDGCACGVYGTV